jgi:NAD(P)-dependent dehydrogenase (short-subunit alcohol dehydrogenase family)
VNQAFIQLSDKVAVVTGASRGIGRATALLFARAGARVVAMARNEQKLAELKAEIDQFGGCCSVVCCDVSQFTQLENALAHIIVKEGAIDILVNNAGIYATDSVQDMAKEDWQKIIDTNTTGSFVATKAVLASMKKSRWGRIIFVSSISGKSGEAYGSAYSASKFAMIGLMQSLALEAASFGITSNAVCPGWVDTEMAHEQINDEKWCNLNSIEVGHSEEIARLSVPQERLIEPSEVANLILYLSSDLARGITGQSINICGGLSVH